MKMRIGLLLMVAIFLSCGGFNPSEELTKAISAALGDDFDGYQSFSYPTDNFGLATIYRSSDAEVTPDEFDCDMWNCIGVADDDIPTDKGARLRMNGFAGLGSGGEISITKKVEERLAFGLVLPTIARIAQISGGLERERVVDVTLQLGQAHSRLLRRDSILGTLRRLPPTHDRRLAFNAGTLALVVADVVVDGFSATIEVRQEAAEELDAKLDGAVSTVIQSDAEIDFELRRGIQGRYTITVASPVIIYRWIRTQSGGGTLSATGQTCAGLAELDECWSGWRAATVTPSLTLEGVPR